MVIEELFNPGTDQGRRLNTVVLQIFVKDYKIKGGF